MRNDLEILIAGSLLIGNINNTPKVDLDLSDFKNQVSKVIIQAARYYYCKGENLDPFKVMSFVELEKDCKLSASQKAEISKYIDVAISDANLSEYVRDLKKHIYREKQDELSRWAINAFKDSKDKVSLCVQIAAKENALRMKYIESPSSRTMCEYFVNFVEKIESGENPKGLVKTYLPWFDELNGGAFLPNEYIVIAARPGTGKTAITGDAMSAMALHGIKSSFHSLEMKKAQLVPRIMAKLAKTNTMVASRSPADLPAQQKKALVDALPVALRVSKNIYVHDDARQTVEKIWTRSRKDVEDGAKAIFVDYLQLLRVPGFKGSRNDELTVVSNEIKNMAKDLDVPVFILSQLSRETEKQKRPPIMSDLRDCGAIENDANNIIFLYDPDFSSMEKRKIKKIMVVKAKGRDTGTGAKPMLFNTDHQCFYEQGPEPNNF